MVETFVLGGVDGHSATAPALAVVTGVTVGPPVTLANPSAWGGIKWLPVQSDYEAKTAARSIYRYRIGFRVRIEIDWGALGEADRSDIIAKINANSDTYLRIWPHVGQPQVYYDCNIEDESSVDSYVVGAPIGYMGNLVLLGRELFAQIPLWEKGYHFTDTDDWAAYLSTDEVVYFTRSTDVLAGNYADTDKIGFFWRRPHGIGGA